MGRATTPSDLDLGGIVAIYGVAPEPPTDLTSTTGQGSAALSWRQPSTGGRPSHFVVGVGTTPGAADLGTFNVGTAATVAGSVSVAPESLLLGETSAWRLAIAAGVPVLAAAWVPLAAGLVLSREMTWGLLSNLEGAWHIEHGHVPLDSAG
jgi:hypothetical protein